MSAPGYGKPTDRNGFITQGVTMFCNFISVSVSGEQPGNSFCTHGDFEGNEVCVIMIMGMIRASKQF